MPAVAPESNRRLRVLIAHNAYQQRGGEDSVVEAEFELLKSRGHDVSVYRRHNEELGAISSGRAAADTLWSSRTRREIADRIKGLSPEIVHVHNTFPLISPSIYSACRDLGVPVVQTLHNFRLICPQAMLLRNSKICELCVGRSPWHGVVHRCYRDSLGQSAVLATMLQLHRWRGTWLRDVTLYIALNEFCRAKFIEGGLPAERIRIKPNFVEAVAHTEMPRSGFLYVGRLSSEKGVDVLARAADALASKTPIRVVGSGPETANLSRRPSLTLVGNRSGDEVMQAMREARALVLPSIWYENYPRTLVEAFACRLPVIASRLGAMASIVEDGVTGIMFEPGNSTDLADKLRWAESHPNEMASMGANARAYFEHHLTPQANYGQLITIYRDAVEAFGRLD